MAIIKRSLGNNRQIIAQKFRETGRKDGLEGLAFSMFCNGWKLAWKECINQSPKLKEAENERLKSHIKALEKIIVNKACPNCGTVLKVLSKP